MASRLGFSPVFSLATIEFFTELGTKRQEKLLACAKQLAAHPFVSPDFTTVDTAGRTICHIMTDGFILDYWVDQAARQVDIIEVCNDD